MPTYLYYQLFDSTGLLKVARANSVQAAADNETGQIDMKTVPPPKDVAEIAKAIAKQEGCKDTFDSSEWSLSYQGPRTIEALALHDLIPKGAGSKHTKCLILKLEGDSTAEREEQGVVLANREKS